MFCWFKYIGIDSNVSTVRQELSGIKYFLPQWTYYSLPDGLWVYSFTSALLIVWDNQFKNAKFWLLVPLFTGLVIEIAQGLKIFPGTFDIIDLIFCFSALLLSIIFLTPKKEKNEIQKEVTTVQL